MNILLLNWRDIWHPKAGGAEIVTMEHAKGWVKRGHKVIWVTSTYKNAKKDEVIDGIIFMRRARSLTINIWGFFYVFFYGNQYDIIIDEIHALPFLTPLATRRKKIAFIHEVAGDIWNYMAPFPLNIAGKFIEHVYLPLYKHVPFWTDANSTIDELVEIGIPKEQCTAIACPINNPMPSVWVQKEQFPVFLFVSRVVAMKGIEEVIKAFSFIIRELPEAQLWIIGGGEDHYVSSLKKLISELYLTQKIIFKGRVSESKKLMFMGKSHVLLHASVKEGWGLVVLEAASQGTPSVVYNVHGLKDVVLNNKTGVVVKKNTPQELAKEALSLYRDGERYSLFQREGKKWVSSITWQQAIDQSEQLLERVVKN